MGLKITRPASEDGSGQRISLCMIMKNEEQYLARCLASVKDVVDEMIIVDTGSTDRSVEIAESFGATVLHEEWEHDFAKHRNTSINAATGDWILVLDADEEMVEAERMRAYLADPTREGYFFREINYIGIEEGGESVAHSAFRLFRNRENYRYFGALHEQILSVVDPNLQHSEFLDIEILHYGYLDPTTENKNKVERNMKLALEEVERRPNDAFVLFNAGVEFQRAGNLETAVEYFTRGFSNIESLTQNYVPLLLRNLVACLGETGRFDEALKIVDDAIEAYHEFTDLYYLKGRLFVLRHDYRKAIEAYEDAIAQGEYKGGIYMVQSGAGSYAAWFAIGVVQQMMGNTAQAAQCFRKSLATAKTVYIPAFNRLAMIAIGNESPEDAVESVRALLPAQRRRADALHSAATAFLVSGLYEQALGFFQEALALEDTAHQYRVGAAQALVGLRRIDEAVAVLDEIPETSDAYWQGCGIRFMAGIASGDDTIVDAAIARGESRILPEMLTAWRMIAGELRGHPVEVPAGQDPVAVTPFVMDAASVLLKLDALEGFSAATGPLRRVAPDRAAVDEALGALLYEHGFHDPAMECLVGAFQAGRELDAGSLLALAKICAAKGMDEAAEDMYRAALQADPERQSLYLDLAGFMVGAGRHSDAAEVLRVGREMWPHSTVMSELHETLSIMALASA